MHANDLTQRVLPGELTRIVVPTLAAKRAGEHFQIELETRITTLAGKFTAYQTRGAWLEPVGSINTGPVVLNEASCTYEVGGLDAAELSNVLRYILEQTGERAVYYTVGTKAVEATLTAHRDVFATANDNVAIVEIPCIPPTCYPGEPTPHAAMGF